MNVTSGHMAAAALYAVHLVSLYVQYALLTKKDAYYCAECTRLEKDRDGCPKAINLGHTRMDAMFNRKMQNMFQQG